MAGQVDTVLVSVWLPVRRTGHQVDSHTDNKLNHGGYSSGKTRIATRECGLSRLGGKGGLSKPPTDGIGRHWADGSDRQWRLGGPEAGVPLCAVCPGAGHAGGKEQRPARRASVE